MKAASFLCCTKIQLVRTHPISCRWLQKSCFCADDRGNNSSSSSSPFPVKYVPKKFRILPANDLDDNKFKVIATPLKFDASAARSVQFSSIPLQKFICDDSQSQTQPQPDFEHQIDRVSATDNHEFIEDPDEEFIQEFIDIHLENNQLPFTKPLCVSSKMKEGAEQSAIKLLATRAYTALELRKKLQQKRFSLDVIQAIIIDFQNRGLINDCLYAETFSRSRWSSSTWGPRRIKQALFKKGVSEGDSEKAIEMVFQEGESDGDKDLIHGLSISSMDRLYVQAAKQWLRSRDVPRETQKSRIIRWLQYRGFNWGIIGHVVKRLETEYPP